LQDSSTSAAQGNRLAQDVKTLLKDRTDTSFSLFWGARILQRKTREIQTNEDPKLPRKRKAPVGHELGEQDTHHFPETLKDHRVWSCLIKFEGHQTFDQKRKTLPLFACLMGDVLFVWTAAYQPCLMRACVPRLLSGLYQLFHLYLIKHVLTVLPLTSTFPCLVTKQCLIVFGRQTFIVCPGPNRTKIFTFAFNSRDKYFHI